MPSTAQNPSTKLSENLHEQQLHNNDLLHSTQILSISFLSVGLSLSYIFFPNLELLMTTVTLPTLK